MVHKNNLIIEINFISSSKQPVNKVQITSMVLHHTLPEVFNTYDGDSDAGDLKLVTFVLLVPDAYVKT